MVFSGQSDFMKKLKKKPKFKRQGEKIIKRLGRKWRRPRGNQSKLRMHKKSRGFRPGPGYGSPKSIRNLHPCGLEEVLVHNVKELEKIDVQKHVCRVASSVGKKKKMDIIKKAGELKIRILNPLKKEKV